MESQEQHLAAVRDLALMEMNDPENNKGTFQLGPFTAFTLVGLLQLTSRHPGLNRTQRNLVKQIIDQIIASFEGHPAHAVLLLGNNPDNDVEHQS
jgi:hypothetical protein